MENVNEIVKQVIKIWRLHKTQQLVLTLAMRQEIPFPLRKLLSRDYMICSVLKKEMANLYDALKCCMRDACILQRDSSNAVMVMNVEGNIGMALAKIISVHRQVVAEYDVLLGLAKDSSLNTLLLRQHQKQMDSMTRELSTGSHELSASVPV